MSNEYGPLKEAFKRQIATAQDEIAALRQKIRLIRELEKDLAKLERKPRTKKKTAKAQNNKSAQPFQSPSQDILDREGR